MAPDRDNVTSLETTHRQSREETRCELTFFNFCIYFCFYFYELLPNITRLVFPRLGGYIFTEYFFVNYIVSSLWSFSHTCYKERYNQIYLWKFQLNATCWENRRRKNCPSIFIKDSETFMSMFSEVTVGTNHMSWLFNCYCIFVQAGTHWRPVVATECATQWNKKKKWISKK